MSKKKGRFITIEGGEGVGKSLFLSHFVPKLSNLGVSVVSTREPGGTTVAENLRKIFSVPPKDESLLVETELFVISAARAQHVKHKIIPSLTQGHWVVCDRFADSTRIYQGFVGGLADSFIEDVIKHSTFGLEPDLTFILDCDVNIALTRLKARDNSQKAASKEVQDGAGRYDEAKLSLHKNLRKGFQVLQEKFPQRIVILDGSKEIQTVVAQAIQIVKDRFLNL